MKKILTTRIPRLVSKQFDFIETTYHSEPMVLLSEVSIAFENEISFNEEYFRKLKAIGIPIIGGARFDKIEQSVIMDRFKINHPQSYYTKGFGCINNVDDFNSYVDLNEFVVKPIAGARGVGVKKINREQFKKCLINCKNVNEVFYEEKEFVKSNMDVSSSYIEDNIYRMLVQESIDVKREFRLILFKPGNHIIYERIKKEGEFCGNLSHGNVQREVPKTTSKKYIEPVIPTFLKIMEDYKYPFLSIDLYVDKYDNVGCFEFQMEFAYEGFDHKLVRELMVNSFNYFL